MATMISETVVSMLHEFCNMARRAISDTGEDKMLDSRSGSVSESMAHNLNVASVMVRIMILSIRILFSLPDLYSPFFSPSFP